MNANAMIVVLMGLVMIVIVQGCKTTDSDLPDEISLPEGVEVVELKLDEDQAGDLPSSGRKGFRVTVVLNKPIPDGEVGIIAFAVRDKELVAGLPLCAGFVGMTNGDGTTATREDMFEMVCEDDKVAGRAISSAFDMDDFDRSSGEKTTKIYIQHLEGLKTFAGATIGISGVKSNKIKVSCK